MYQKYLPVSKYLNIIHIIYKYVLQNIMINHFRYYLQKQNWSLINKSMVSYSFIVDHDPQFDPHLLEYDTKEKYFFNICSNKQKCNLIF